MELRKNHGNTCFGISLANLLIVTGDIEDAKLVCENYRLSPLVRNNGDIHPALTPRIVRDLTKERYNAILHVNWGKDPIESIRESYQEGFDTPDVKKLTEVVQEETMGRNIRAYQGGIVRASIPNIHFLQQLPLQYSHAVVYLGDDSLGNCRYFNDGELQTGEDLVKLGLDIKAVALLEVLKSAI